MNRSTHPASRTPRRLLLAASLTCGLAISASAQVGTYVAPRINTVFNQPVSNTVTYTFYGTNWLNMTGWHNMNWIFSEYAYGPGGTNQIGTNQLAVNLYGSPGNGNNYTNAAAGTNFVFIPTPLQNWTNNLTASNTLAAGFWTNTTQNLGDGFLWFKGAVTVGCTNAAVSNQFYLQIDQIITP
jgi:hypothetical protein